MRKFLSITLAIFVLCATVCVFFPTSTASAAEYYEPDYTFLRAPLPTTFTLHDFHGVSHSDAMLADYFEQWNGISWIKLGSLASLYDFDIVSPETFKISFSFTNSLSNFALLFYVIEPFAEYDRTPAEIDCDAHYKVTDTDKYTSYVDVADNLLLYSNYYHFKNTAGKSVSDVELLFHANMISFFPEFFDNVYVAFVSLFSDTNASALPSVLQTYTFYRAYNNVFTQSESYLAGVVDGKNEAFSMLDSFPLTTIENIDRITVEGVDSEGAMVRVGHFSIDYNHIYSGSQYLALSNITPVSVISKFVVRLYFKQSYVPLSIRMNRGYNSFSNGTASPITALSYYGNQLYGRDFTDFSQSNYVEIVFPWSSDTPSSTYFFRIMGSSYGATLDKAYNNGVEDGKLLAEKGAYNKGYSDGVNASNKFTFFNLISSIIDVPINAILSLFNLEIFGFNLAPMLTAILSLCIVLTIIKMVL